MFTTPFFEAQFKRAAQPRPYDHWRDISTEQYFVWESMFGRIALQKRPSYPQTFAFVRGDNLYCGYGNLKQAQAIFGMPLHEVPESMFYDDEFLLLIINCQTQTVAVQRDAFGTMAIFAGHTRNQLVLSSSFEKTCTALPQRSLHVNKRSLMEHLLMLGSRSNTLFEEVQVLYDRARLVWEGHYRSIEAPDAVAILQAQDTRTADAQLFVRFLEETLDRYWQRYGGQSPVACDLSGGYDSSLITGYFADKQRPIVTGTLIYPGAFGTSVQHKLAAFQQRFAVPNVAVHMDPNSEYPLVDMATTGSWRPFYPARTLYGASLAKVADKYAQAGAAALFNGIGGDELCQNISPLTALGQGEEAYRERLRTPMPGYSTPVFHDLFAEAMVQHRASRKSIPILAYSVVQQNVGAYDDYLARGLWPVAPLADPRLFIYCQSLPIRYRTQKNLLKMYLQARAFPDVLYGGNKQAQEHFGAFFDLSVARNLKEPMRQFFASSVLAKEGLINKDYILRQLDAPTDDEVWLELYVLFGIEVNLQTLGITHIT